MAEPGRFLSGAILVTLLVSAAPLDRASAESEPAAKEEAAAKSENQLLSESIEELIAAFRVETNEADALYEDAKAAGDQDAFALSAAALDIRLDSLDIIKAALAKVSELEELGGDVSEFRKGIARFLPALSKTIRSIHAGLLASITNLQTASGKAAAGDAVDLEQRIRREEVLIGRVQSAAVDQAARLEQFELDSKAEREWTTEIIATRARLMAGRINLATVQLLDLEANGGADLAAVQARAIELQSRLTAATQSLTSSIELMEALEVDASRYKQILISSTGEITTDILDTQVAGQLLSRWASGVQDSIADNGPRILFQIVLFAIVMTLFWALSRFVRRVTQHAVEAPHLRFSQLLKRMIVSLASGTVMVVGLLVALSQLGIEVGPVVAGLGIAGFIVGFALQETLGNFAAGVMILVYRPYDVGDLIECAGSVVFGTVSHMSLVSTTILTLDNKTRVVPNGKIWGDVITNVTAQKVRRVDLVFGISYTDDIPHAEEVLWSIIKEHPKVVADPEPNVKLHELGDSSVNFVVRPWTARDDYWDVHWDITREVKMRFDREGISIPFPQRDVHFYPSNENGATAIDMAAAPVVGSTNPSAQDAPEAEA